MEYNFIKIGKRLKKERKAAGFKSHDALSNYIREHNYRCFTRQTIAKWEQGKELPPLDVLCTLCIPFNCEVGYLLCEYDCKTRIETDIQLETGLSRESVERLRYFIQKKPRCVNILNQLLTSLNFENLLWHLDIFMDAYKTLLGLRKIRKNKIDKAVSERDLETNAFNPPSGDDALLKAIDEYENKYAIQRIHVNDDFSYIIKELQNANNKALNNCG